MDSLCPIHGLGLIEATMERPSVCYYPHDYATGESCKSNRSDLLHGKLIQNNSDTTASFIQTMLCRGNRGIEGSALSQTKTNDRHVWGLTHSVWLLCLRVSCFSSGFAPLQPLGGRLK